MFNKRAAYLSAAESLIVVRSWVLLCRPPAAYLLSRRMLDDSGTSFWWRSLGAFAYLAALHRGHIWLVAGKIGVEHAAALTYTSHSPTGCIAYCIPHVPPQATKWHLFNLRRLLLP